MLCLSEPLGLIGFTGDASWTGYALISGHWYSGPHQVDVNTAFLNDTGLSVGDSYTLTSGGRHTTITVAGEVFDPQGSATEMIGARSTFAPVDPQLETGGPSAATEPAAGSRPGPVARAW